MNKRFLIFAFIISFACTRDLSQMRKIAFDNYRTFTLDEKIDTSLFVGPKLSMGNNGCFIFTWESKVPIMGAALIKVIVPKRMGKDQVFGTGSNKSWDYLDNTIGKTIPEAMAYRLYDLSIVDKNRKISIETACLSEVNINDLANFIEIKRAIIDYCFRRGGYPLVLDSLGLENDITCNKYNVKYKYEPQYPYVKITSYYIVDDAKLDEKGGGLGGNEYLYSDSNGLVARFRPVTNN